MKVYTTFILSASITRPGGVTYAKLTHTVARVGIPPHPTYFLQVVWPTRRADPA